MRRVWQNGQIVDLTEARISITDRGFLLGDGLFETMPVYRHRVFDLDAHLERLASGLALLNLGEGLELAKLRAEIAAYLAAEEMESAVLRLTITRGPGPRGLLPPETLCPTVLMTLSSMPAARKEPLALHVAAVTRRNECSPLSRIKALPYLDNVLALQEARTHGADEALLLNTRGTIACASAANVFALREGLMETSLISDGALPGTMRGLVLTLAKEAGLAAVERTLYVEDLAAADEVFITNSISRLTMVKECNGEPIGGRAARAVEQLRALIAARFDAM
jgi:branched-chain amino acid aminotransferase